MTEHFNDAMKSRSRDWFVICLQGSQNYNLDNKDSDIDTKLLTLPSLQDLVSQQSFYSTTHIMENNEHVDIKDVRSYFKLFEKANMSFVEILFTDYYICNPEYQCFWETLIGHREEIAYMNPYRTLSCAKGMASEKRHALCHEYPSRMYYIENYGYDGKQLSHLLRLQDFVDRYIEHLPYSECIKYDKDSPRAKEIVSIKRHSAGIDKEEAIAMADEVFNDISKKVDVARQHLSNETNSDTKDFLNCLCLSLLKCHLKKEVLER